VLDNGTALLLWFTYPPAGSSAQQAWIYADGGAIENERIRFTNALTTRGGRFGATSGPVSVQRIPWGTVEFRFTSCNAGEVTFSGPAGWGSGTRPIVRLTEHAELGCAGKQRLVSSGPRAMEGLRQRTGGWYNAASDADGWALEELSGGRALVYWFTHDAAGRAGVDLRRGEPSPGDRSAVTNYRPWGTRFGSAFDASRVMLTSWGTLDITFDGCDRASLAFTSLDTSFGERHVEPHAPHDARRRGVPRAEARGAHELARGARARRCLRARSEIAVAELRHALVRRRRLRRRNAISSATTRPRTPGPCSRRSPWDATTARHSLSKATCTSPAGTARTAAPPGGDTSSPAEPGRPVPELPFVAASGAAMLGGFVYFGGLTALVQYNPRTRQSRVIAATGRAQRDHSQVVAFQGEIWFIAGRGNGFTNRVVSIYDPASETWRAGPLLATSRAGFAAAASATTLFVAGGEFLDPSPPSTIYARWKPSRQATRRGLPSRCCRTRSTAWPARSTAMPSTRSADRARPRTAVNLRRPAGLPLRALSQPPSQGRPAARQPLAPSCRPRSLRARCTRA
jgi:hypothetical protein